MHKNKYQTILQAFYKFFTHHFARYCVPLHQHSKAKTNAINVMNEHELQVFQILKIKLQQTLQNAYPHYTREMPAWKSEEIISLQEQLHQKVKGYISEKWFYTHLKPSLNTKLPRIDMLDMLAQYVGYQGWQDFLYKENKDVLQEKESQQEHFSPTNVVENTQKNKPLTKICTPANWKAVSLLTIILILFLGFTWRILSQQNTAIKIEFCFQDADTKKAITKDIEVMILNKNESPQLQKISNKGCINLDIPQKTITFVVKAKYYKTDTIIRSIAKGLNSEVIKLQKDDYARLIHLISKQETTESAQIQKQKQLQTMFDENAQIFQVDETGLGVELYSKEDFIAKLYLPLTSLKNLEIVETKYKNDQIILLRFIQK